MDSKRLSIVVRVWLYTVITFAGAASLGAVLGVWLLPGRRGHAIDFGLFLQHGWPLILGALLLPVGLRGLRPKMAELKQMTTHQGDQAQE